MADETKAEWDHESCTACGGTGKVIASQPAKPAWTGQVKINPLDCPVCGGTGRIKKAD